MPKIIRVSSCNICPYYLNRSHKNYDTHEHVEDRKCIAIEQDELGYNTDISTYVINNTIPNWCPLEEDSDNQDEIQELIFQMENN